MGMSVDHSSGVSAPNSDAVFLHVRAGMTVNVEDGSDWRMADVIWVDGGARNPKVPTLFQVADVDTGVINVYGSVDSGNKYTNKKGQHGFASTVTIKVDYDND